MGALPLPCESSAQGMKELNWNQIPMPFLPFIPKLLIVPSLLLGAPDPFPPHLTWLQIISYLCHVNWAVCQQVSAQVICGAYLECLKDPSLRQDKE